ncbi:MAG TPA: hypothetical protein VFD23_06935 [Clostridia bacterium]|nr:hypothetical protein [Clostridia bacterium]
MNKKRIKMIKSGVSLFATALVLIVVTVAWFSSGGKANVEGIGADVVSEGLTYMLYEAVDDEKIGGPEPPSGADWVTVGDSGINIENAVPNQYRYFKAHVKNIAKQEIQVKFTDIVITEPQNAATEDFLKLINVHFYTEGIGNAPVPGGEVAYDETMDQIVGIPVSGDVVIYTLDMTNYQGEEFDIYYTIGVDESFQPKQDFLGASVSIGAIVFE